MGLFFNTMYNVVDTYFGGYISTRVLAAMSLSLPVFFVIISIGRGISTGSTALIGTALGEKNKSDARSYVVQSICFAMLISIVLTVAGIAISPFLFKILGASDEYLAICMEYVTPLLSGAVLFLSVYMLNAILNSVGDTRSYRNFLILAFFLNVGLDPWFIFGGFFIPPMGIQGIALATVIVQAIGCIYLAFKVQKTGLISNLKISQFKPRLTPFKEIAYQGFPAGLNIATIAIGVFVITYFISDFGKDGVAAYGVATRVEQIVLLPTIALNIAVLAIVAQNHGARKFDRIRVTFYKSLFYGALIMIAGSTVVFFFSSQFMSFFTDNQNVINIGSIYLKIDALTLYAYVILFVSVALLQGLKKPMFAIYIGIFRQIAAPIALFYYFAYVLDLKVVGVFWGIFTVTWIAAIISLGFAVYKLKKLQKSQSKFQPMPDTQ